MITVRHIERLWTAKAYEKLFRELMCARPEASFRVELELGRAVGAAAIALIRLDELSQAQAGIASTLVRTLVAAQEADGGWGDPMITALCLRALLCGDGHGQAIERGLAYLANMQKSEGIWPKVPFRRMPADPFVSAFILFQLGQNAQFRSAVRFLDALNWFETNEASLDPEARRLWDLAGLRCRLQATAVVEAWAEQEQPW